MGGVYFSLIHANVVLIPEVCVLGSVSCSDSPHTNSVLFRSLVFLFGIQDL